MFYHSQYSKLVNYWVLVLKRATDYFVFIQTGVELEILSIVSWKNYKNIKTSVSMFFFTLANNTNVVVVVVVVSFFVSFLLGVGNTLSVPLSKCLSNCLLSATPPHRINQYWWNVTQLQYENVHEGRLSWSEIYQGIIISSVGRGMSICDSTQSTSLISFNWYTCVSHDKSLTYKK